MNYSAGSNIQSLNYKNVYHHQFAMIVKLKYQMFTPTGCKGIRIRDIRDIRKYRRKYNLLVLLSTRQSKETRNYFKLYSTLEVSVVQQIFPQNFNNSLDITGYTWRGGSRGRGWIGLKD